MRLRHVLFICIACITGCSENGSAPNGEGAPATSGSPVEQIADTGATFSADLSSYQISYNDPANGTAEDTTTPVVESDEPFVVVDFGPRDELPSELKRPSVYVLFSQPVIPLTSVGKEAESPAVTITPPIRGTLRWYGTRLVSFDADEDVEPQTEYTVAVRDGITSLGGKQLRGQRGFSFVTEELTVTDSFAGNPSLDRFDLPVADARNVYLRFSYPVDPETMARSIRATYDGEPLETLVARPAVVPDVEDPILEHWLLVVLQGISEPGKPFTVTVERGARSSETAAPTRTKIQEEFATLKPFTFEEWDTYSWYAPIREGGDINPVYLRFSHPVLSDDVERYISSVPADVLSGSSIEVWEEMVIVNNPGADNEETFTLLIDGNLTDVYGRTLGVPQRLRVTIPPAYRYASFPNQGARMLEAGFPPRIVWETQNVFDGDFTAGPVDDPYRFFEADELKPYSFRDNRKNVAAIHFFDFERWLNDDGKGWVGFSWNFAESDKGVRPEWAKTDLTLQVTDIGVTMRYSYNRVVAMVASLGQGSPVVNAEVDLMRLDDVMMTTTTDERGFAFFDLEEGEYVLNFRDENYEWRDNLRVGVRHGLDRIVFEPSWDHDPWYHGVYDSSSPLYAERSKMTTFIFTDRGLYRPGEEVKFRGIDQNLYLGDYQPYWGPYTIRIMEATYDGEVLRETEGNTTMSGAFYGAYTIPEDRAPGFYRIEYERDGETWSEGFQVAEFRRLTFGVEVETPDQSFIAGDSIGMQFYATSLSGDSMSGAPYEVAWFREPVTFSPPGAPSGMRFGTSEWYGGESLGGSSGTLDADGSAVAALVTNDGLSAGLTYRYSAEARVSNINGVQVAGRGNVLVHPAAFTVGVGALDSAGGWSSFVAKGDEFDMRAMVFNHDGSPYRDRVADDQLNVRLLRIDWKIVQRQGIRGRVNTHYERVEEIESEQSIRIEQDSRETAFTVTPSKAGLYVVSVSGFDGLGRTAETRYEFYATGSDWIRWGGQDDGSIDLTPDKALYQPGDTATILVKSPLQAGRYLVTVEREGIVDDWILDLEGSAQAIGVPIKDNYVPVVYVSVSSYSGRTGPPADRYGEPDLGKPKGYYGVVPLAVDVSSRTIELTIEPTSTGYRPGEEVEIEITATKNGRPAENVELTFMAVDRGITDLIGYRVPDPVAFFYDRSRFPLAVSGSDSRSLLIDPVTYEMKDLAGGDSGDGKGDEERSDFRGTAVFEPFVETDRRGKATVRFTLPDSLTTYRLTAVAAKESSFGIGEDELLVNNPINVKPFLPLQFRYRDTAYAGVTLSNLLDSEQEIEVWASSDLLALDDEEKRSVTLAPRSTNRVSFRVAAIESGTGTLSFRVLSDVFNETVTEDIEVTLPSVIETVTLVGSIADGEAAERGETVVLPSADTGELTLSFAAGRVGSLTSAFTYVADYPFACFEQRTAKTVPLVMFGDRLIRDGRYATRFALEDAIIEEMTFWGARQLSDGGFPFWPDGKRSSLFASVKIGHLLSLARFAGFRIPPVIDTAQLVEYLSRNAERSRSLTPYAYYVRALLGDRVSNEVSRFLDADSSLGISDLALCALAYTAEGRERSAVAVLAEISRFLRPGTRSVDITETYESRGFYDARSTRIAQTLLLFAALDPQNEMVDRLSYALMSRMQNGRWEHTSATSWALIALSAVEDLEAEPDFEAAIRISDVELMKRPFLSSGQPTETAAFGLNDEPMSSLPRSRPLPLRFSRDGTGDLYYAASLRYSIDSETARPVDMGFSVFFEVSDLEGAVVQPDEIQVGRTYRGRVVISTTRDRRYVAVRIPVPSGVDMLESSFLTTATYDEYEESSTRTEVRAGEARYFYEDVQKGLREETFLFRALVPGVYPVPPVTAECMYEPEVFGRTGGSLYLIKPAAR